MAATIWTIGNSILIIILGNTNQIVASVTSTSVVIVLDYFVKRNYVFESKKCIKKSFAKYLLLTIFSWSILNLGLYKFF